MAKNSLTDVLKSVQSGEDADQAYSRLFSSQMRPCTFRRVYAALQRGETTTEVDAQTASTIAGYVKEKIDVDEAFKIHCPDFVTPGEFSVAFEKEMKARKSAQQPLVSKQAKKSPAVAQEEKSAV